MGSRGARSSISGGTQAMSLDEFLASRGLSQAWYSDQGFADTNTGRLKGRAYKETERLMQQRSAEYASRRNNAIKEYNSLVKSGKIRKPSRYEETLKISKGNPNSPQTQAAKRLLKIMKERGLD